MADFLTAVKSVRTHRDEATQDSLLEAVTSTNHKAESQKNGDKTSEIPPHEPASAEDALQILRSQPDTEQLVTALRYLTSSSSTFRGNGAIFRLEIPGPLQAQIINTLLNTIVPNFWPNLSTLQRTSVIECLQNVAGFNAVIARLKFLSSASDRSSSENSSQQISDVLDIANRLFAGDDKVRKIWEQLQTFRNDKIKRDLAWKDFENLIASGKVIACVAQAEDAVKDLSKASWLAKGSDYATWLGKNIAVVYLLTADPESKIDPAAQILAKALTLGYPGQMLQGVFEKLFGTFIGIKAPLPTFVTLVKALPSHTKRSFTEHTLRWLSALKSSTGSINFEATDHDISAIAGFLSLLMHDESIKQHLISAMTDPAILSTISLSLRRACLAALARFEEDDDMQTLFDKIMSTFSNSLFINHAPVLQQESLAQALLLAAGHVHRRSPMALLIIARSSNHMQGVSNRLDSSNARARWLGMVVGTAISSLVDKEGSKMSFVTDEMETEEAAGYLTLVRTKDELGSLNDFEALLSRQEKIDKVPKKPKRGMKVEKMPILNGKPTFGPPRPPVQTEVIGEKVTEILDDESEDEDDLKPYAKPDSDPEDSDEDATLVNRNKVRPPVYIRDLMSMLRDSEKHDRFQLGIKHAATLIRRKANFGAEVKDHANELAVILCNLQDPFNTDDFEEMKLQALIAVLLSEVKSIPSWLCRQAFSSDYSISQRCIILSAIGLGGRELAGLKNEDELNPAIANTDFPSKRLPPRLHSTYTLPSASTKQLESATKAMEHALINPLALQAADQSTAHLNAVKVRTFSSRMDVARTKRKPAPNQLAKVLGESFFFPLLNRYQQEIAAYGAASVFASVPVVLVTFLKTLALLLHASGPATIGLSRIFEEFWDLLLSLRVQASTDITVLQAVLFGLLTLLEINYDKRRIAEECPKQLMETQRWADLVFERTGGGGVVSEDDGGDEAKVRTLAAGVLVKTQEIIGAYQKQLAGYDFD